MADKGRAKRRLEFHQKRKHQILAGSEEAAAVLERCGDAAEDRDAPEAFLIRRENLQELAQRCRDCGRVRKN